MGAHARDRRRRRKVAACIVAVCGAASHHRVTAESCAFVAPDSTGCCCFRRNANSSVVRRRPSTFIAPAPPTTCSNAIAFRSKCDSIRMASGNDDGLTTQERILRSAGLSPETPEEREERLKRREEAETKLRAEKRINVAVAVVAFLAALFNYGWKYTHPVTPVQVLAEMQSQSAPLDVIGRNGRPTVVDFWAPWCENCKFAAPTLQAIEKEYDGKVNFVMVNADQGSAWKAVERFGVDAIPHLAMISAEGDVETALIGPIPRNVLRADLDVLLNNADTAAKGKEICELSTSTVPATGAAASTNVVASATEEAGVTVAENRDVVLPYDVPMAESQLTGSKSNSKSATASCDAPKEELPYVMLDVFRNRPEMRRVTF